MRKRPYQDDEDDEDRERGIAHYGMMIHRAQREKVGVIRRGRRRWWESYKALKKDQVGDRSCQDGERDEQSSVSVILFITRVS